jgi:pyruvate ferredoxin oxidoreductase alpha subunit
MPTQQQVDAYLPPFEPRQVLDPNEPVSIGAMVGPEAFTEVRYLAHAKQMQALDLIPGWADEFRRAFGRESGGLVHTYRVEDADTVVVALGSVLGTIKDTIDEMRSLGARIGVLGISCFRPWPRDAVQQALARASRVIVLEKSLAVGIGGIVSTNVRTTSNVPVHTVIAGLGGRPITRASLHKVFSSHNLDHTTFLDLDRPLVEKVLAREKGLRRSGPRAEQILKEKHGVPAR